MNLEDIKRILSGKKLANTLNVTVEQIFLDGEPTESVSADSAMARPFRVLIDEGRRVGRTSNLFYRDITNKHAYLVGSLCHSVAGRLIFLRSVQFLLPCSHGT